MSEQNTPKKPTDYGYIRLALATIALVWRIAWDLFHQ